MSEETKWFPRKETNSPRTLIYRNECPDELHIFEVCLGDNGGSLSECATQNAALETCGSAAFKMINSMTQTYNFDKGLKHQVVNPLYASILLSSYMEYYY